MNNVQNMVAQNVSFDVLFYGAVILLLFLGGIFCLFGFRTLKIFMGIIGCLLGGLTGFDFGQLLGHHNLIYSVIGAVVGCSLGALVGVFLYWINIFFVGFCAGASAVLGLWMLLVVKSSVVANPLSFGLPILLTALVAGVAVGLAALKLQKYVVIAFTAFNGAELMVLSVFCYCHRELVTFLLNNPVTAKPPILEKDLYLIIISVLVITGLGIVAQMTDRSAQKKPSEAKPQKA